jgi:5-formyltetrahydrofolate cyclo-ligase
MMECKDRLRARAKEVRSRLSAETRAAAARQVAEIGLEFAEPAPGACVSGFLAIGEEINPVPLMRVMANAAHRLCLPVLQGRGKPLMFREWTRGQPLVERMWGIREPTDAAAVVTPDVLIVPLLAFDSEGWRLGYGGGYYDRTLAELRRVRKVTAIGIAYDEQKVDAVPHLDYDQRLDWVLTPSGPIRCSGR